MLIKRHGLEKPSGLGAGWDDRVSTVAAGADGNRNSCWGWSTRQAPDSLLRQLHFLEAEIDRVQKPLEELANEPRHKPIIEELRQEAGVGLLTAMVYRDRDWSGRTLWPRTSSRQV